MRRGMQSAVDLFGDSVAESVALATILLFFTLQPTAQREVTETIKCSGGS